MTMSHTSHAQVASAAAMSPSTLGLADVASVVALSPMNAEFHSTPELKVVTRHERVLFVCSAGGHLAQLLQLKSWYGEHERLWVTFELPDAVSLLGDEAVVWGHYPTTRNLPNLWRNTRLAVREIRRMRPTVVVSSGAAIAVPFFWVAKLFGAKTVYLEVIDRIDTRTMTARLVSPVTDVIVAQDESQRALFPGCHVIGPLL